MANTPRVIPVQEVPSNFDVFRSEIAEGIGALFGPAAKEQYYQQAETQFRLSLQHPSVRAYGVMRGEGLAGVLLAVLPYAGAARIPFYHVLADYAEQDVPRLLIEGAIELLRDEGLRHIVAECVSTGRAQFDKAFREIGFSRVDRLVMSASLGGKKRTMTPPFPATKPFGEDEIDAVGSLLAEVYRNHVDRPLHVDLQNESDAARFVRDVFWGAYGTTSPEYLRQVTFDHRLAGVILGCEVSRECGFVLHVAVRPEYQNRGFGGRLMEDLLREFQRKGLITATLAVTGASPAVRLYERFGFTVLKSFDTFFWQFT